MKRSVAFVVISVILGAVIGHTGGYLLAWGPDETGYRWFMLTHHGEGPDGYGHVVYRYCDSAGTYTFGYKTADGTPVTDVVKHATAMCKEAGLLAEKGMS